MHKLQVCEVATFKRCQFVFAVDESKATSVFLKETDVKGYKIVHKQHQ